MGKGDNKARYERINKFLDIIGLALVVALVIMTFIYWGNAPDIIPTHYNFKGEVDAYGSKNTVFILLPIVLITYIGIAVLSKFPQVYNYPVEINLRNKEKQYLMASTFIRVLNVEIVTLFFFIQMNSGKVLSIAFLFIFLLIIFGSIGFYIYKAIKCK
ncbi:DUF1648 domain-containing protein [Clostridium saudiense]|uniref:DUF1648 domain-containing protein n=1 Tax=Clostridium saudiense TaxID=1414720 RepID=UPI00082068A8|nr:DUF1648 domain-containing protein [Clostridium saudiense]MDU7454643.1 DUF1648 domain-containing protein [Clostridium saudiense]MEE0725787.1 DUF1648 domain-containing protein [Clostridium saudiense]SCJ53448.1 Predicted integral membrane protein [uncultured Clostridium sp.]